MNHFSIKNIESLCGIKAHTLRIWELRYDLFVAKRKESQHRIYDNDDLKQLLRISFLYHNGYKISKIARLDASEILENIQQSMKQEHNQDAYIQQLLEAGIDFDKEKFESIINTILQRFDFETCIKEIFFPFLEKIGLFWVTSNIIPAQEHFVSHIIQKKIIMAINGLELADTSLPGLVLFTPVGEHHEISLLVANYFLRKNNIRTIYFGINVDKDCIRTYLNDQPVAYVYTHIITYLNNTDLEDYFNALCNDFPKTKFVLSGPVFKGIKINPSNHAFIHSLDEMIAFAKKTAEMYQN